MNSKAIAATLWDVGAIEIGGPFKLASGKHSPIYIDSRRLISYPWAMRNVITAFCDGINCFEIPVDVVAGGESAGIPFAAFLAKELNLPMVYVRKNPKGYGTRSLVEGVLPGRNYQVILVEDLITDGSSKMGFIEALRDTGNKVRDCLVVFDRQQGGWEFLAGKKVNLWSLCNMNMIIDYLWESKRISTREINSVHEYFQDPKVWHLERGFSWTEV